MADQQKAEVAISIFIDLILSSQEFNRAGPIFLKKMLDRWSGDSTWRKTVAGRVRKTLSGGLFEPRTDNRETDARQVATGASYLVNSALQSITLINENMNRLPPAERAELLKTFFKGIDAGLIGRLITSQARLIADISGESPGYLSELAEPFFCDFIESVDFGEVKEAFDSSEDQVAILFRDLAETMWKYPAKVVCLLSIIPALINMGVRAACESTRPFNNLSPDLLADVAFSLLGEVKGREAGLLANEILELIRKLHTGSALLGESGSPLFATRVRPFFEDFFSSLDPDLLYKARVTLAEDRETISGLYVEALSGNEELYAGDIGSFSSRVNPKVRAARKKIGLFEGFSEGLVAKAVSAGVVDLDTQEIGEAINSVLRLTNLIQRHSPGMLPSLLSQVVQAIDTEELKDAAQSLTEDIVEAIKPAARVVMPSVINGLCSLLAPDLEDDNENLEAALSSFREIICPASRGDSK